MSLKAALVARAQIVFGSERNKFRIYIAQVMKGVKR